MLHPLLMIDYASRGAARSLQFRLPVLRTPSHNYRKQVDKPGSCSVVWISENSTTVLKAPLAFHLDGCDDAVTMEYRSCEKESVELLEREKEIYMHLGEHKGILPCFQSTDSGLVFPYLKNGNLRHFLCNSAELIVFSMRLDWIQTALRSIQYIHSKGVLQADISARNFLVADDLSLCLCDFSGSMIGARKNLVRPETRYEKFEGTEPVDISVRTEIFAVGSLIYEISTGKRPYDELEDGEVEHLFRQGVFPTTSSLYFGGIINNCWLGHYKTVAEILHAGPFTEGTPCLPKSG
ncbi:kinase-like protein [Cucurbitaria berberidis CBS 394.84]|uniref:Kinase-like protein n=1 Tax=Cucurbitaria berberidis CBS 394.84 TaxID=1168544 RepID=A0A9P4G7F9_9PLEO|nr:kinase-like protein [Cucurbitaria berberidis CBS 394.84]KAF1840129.1 kinase-like protein [Cucurbitaria berberidis CBS 394.84]